MYRISIIGCGFVGLCLAVVSANKGVKIIAVDIDEAKVNKIKSGEPTFYEPNLKELLTLALKENLTITTDIDFAVKNSDVTFVTVGTPSKSDGNANLDFLESAIKSIARSLKNKKEYHTVVIKSTVLPTTTTNIVKPILEKESGKATNNEIGLVVNPEFLREGVAIYDTENPHLIVIGSNEKKPADILEAFYKFIYDENLPEIIRTSCESAELIKYANNSFLATKISFINTIANICQNIPSTDVKTIAYAIGKDPRIGPLFLQAGPGYGGSCFPKDVNAFINFSRKVGYEPELIAATQKVNELQPTKILELVKKEIGTLVGKRISVLGLSFKKDTDDVRESVSIKLITQLLENGAIIYAHDPMAIENSRKIFGDKVVFCNDINKCLENTECCVIMTDWEEYKQMTSNDFYNMKQPVVVDARRVLDSTKFRSNLRFIAIGTN
jgi:UDPglucose 6-dehydrogenase